MTQVAITGTNLFFTRSGRGPSVLFIHGMCGDARTWDDQMARLSDAFHCVAYDRRGHSRSPLGCIDERSVELHADDAAGLVRALDLAPCLLVGSSGGARVALDVVRRYPDLLAGAVLSEPPLFALDADGAKAIMGAVRPRIERAVAEGGSRAAVDAFFEYMCPGLWKSLPETGRNRYRDNQVELFGDLQMPQYQVARGDLARIQTPCLIVSGSESLSALRDIARILAEGIPNARSVELAGSGHVTYFEKPAEFAAAVRAFATTLMLAEKRRAA